MGELRGCAIIQEKDYFEEQRLLSALVELSLEKWSGNEHRYTLIDLIICGSRFYIR